MNKFTRIAESALSKTNLLRVRLKVDPINKIGIDFREYDGYEGYILQENDKKYDIILDDFSTRIMNVPMVIVDFQKVDEDQFCKLKKFALLFLKDVGKFTRGLASQIAEAPDLQFFDQYLKGAGLSDIDVKDIYCNALFGKDDNIIGEGIKDAAIGAGKAFKYAVPGYISNKVIAPRIDKATEWLNSKPNIYGSVDKKRTPEEQKLQKEYFRTLTQDEKQKGPLITYRVGYNTHITPFNVKLPADIELSIKKYNIINFSPHHVTFEYFPDRRQYEKWRDSGLVHWQAPAAAASQSWIYIITGYGENTHIKPVQFSQLSSHLPSFNSRTTNSWGSFIKQLTDISINTKWDTRFIIAFNAHPIKYIRPITAGQHI